MDPTCREDSSAVQKKVGPTGSPTSIPGRATSGAVHAMKVRLAPPPLSSVSQPFQGGRMSQNGNTHRDADETGYAAVTWQLAVNASDFPPLGSSTVTAIGPSDGVTVVVGNQGRPCRTTIRSPS